MTRFALDPELAQARGDRWRLSTHTASVSAEESRRRAQDQIAWLRDYAPIRVNSQLIDERRCIPPYIAHDFGAAGLFGSLIETRYGGTALRFSDMFRVFEQLMAIDTTLGTWLGTSLFPGTRSLSVWASEEVKQQWLPLLAAGRTLGAYAQTETGAGSDFTQLATTAQPVDHGWLINGDKQFIGNGTWAGISTVIARPGGASTCGSSSLVALAVPTANAGVLPGEEHLTFGLRGMVQSRMRFAGVRVPDSHLLANGDGRRVAMDSMSATRLGFAAFALGALKRILQLGYSFACRRHTGGLSLVRRAWVHEWLVETVARTDVLETLVYDLARRLDAGEAVDIEPVITAKVLGSDWAVEAAYFLMQLMGGRGYDEANISARMYRDLRVYPIFEGPSEALRDFLGRRVLRQMPLALAMVDRFCGTVLRERFAAALDALPDHQPGLADAFHGPVAAALMWTLAAGAVHRAGTASPNTHAAIETNLLQVLNLPGRLRCVPTSASADLLEDAMARYEQHIGFLAQHMPGARTSIDPLIVQGASDGYRQTPPPVIR